MHGYNPEGVGVPAARKSLNPSIPCETPETSHSSEIPKNQQKSPRPDMNTGRSVGVDADAVKPLLETTLTRHFNMPAGDSRGLRRRQLVHLIISYTHTEEHLPAGPGRSSGQSFQYSTTSTERVQVPPSFGTHRQKPHNTTIPPLVHVGKRDDRM